MAHPYHVLGFGLLFSLGCSDASRIRAIGVIVPPAASSVIMTETERPKSRSALCKERATKHLHASVIARAETPVFDLQTQQLVGELSFHFVGPIAGEAISDLRRERVAWIYGNVVVDQPNDAALLTMERLTIRFANQPKGEREAPILGWKNEGDNVWASNKLAIRFVMGMIRSVDAHDDALIDEPISTHLKPSRLKDMELHATEVAMPSEPTVLRYFHPTLRGRAFFRPSLIEFWSSSTGRYCIPVTL